MDNLATGPTAGPQFDMVRFESPTPAWAIAWRIAKRQADGWHVSKVDTFDEHTVLSILFQKVDP